MPDDCREKFTLNGNNCTLLIEENLLTVNFLGKKKDLVSANDNTEPEVKTIPISEILSVKCQRGEKSGDDKTTIFSPKKRQPAILIDTFKRCKDYKWKLITLKLKSPKENLCRKWTQNIQSKIDGLKACRPRRLLVFVNPCGGRGLADPVYRKNVKPIFEIAGIETTVIKTEYRHHAKNYITEEDISVYDGIVAVGGDGMVNEVVNGLICRTQKENDKAMDCEGGDPMVCPKYVRPTMRIGVVPAGSTDCVSYVTHGINDAETSALHIAIGDCHPVDVTSLHNDKGVFKQFSLSLTGYGFYGDLLRKSESVRWMGPPRYSYVGINAFIQNKAYHGEIHYLPGSNSEGPKSSSFCRSPCQVCQEGFGEEGAQLFTPVTPSKHFFSSVETSPASLSLEYENGRRESQIRKGDLDRAVTLETQHSDCDVTVESDVTVFLDDVTSDLERRLFNGPVSTSDTATDVTLSSEVTPTETSKCISRRTKLDAGDESGITFSAAVRPTSLCIAQEIEERGDEKEKWEVIRGKFIVVNAAPISCACERAPLGLSPASHLSDGELDLITVRSCSRTQFLRYLLAHTNKGDRFNFPFVEVRRVKAFRFSPFSSIPSSSSATSSSATTPVCGAEAPRSSGSPDDVQISLNQMSVRYRKDRKSRRSEESLKRSKSVGGISVSTWNSDGEVVADADMTVRVHRGLILMFCRGIENGV